MDYSLLPLWLWLVGIPIAMYVSGKEIATLTVNKRWDGEEISLGILVGVICSALWPVVGPIWLSFNHHEPKVAAEHEAAKERLATTKELDTLAAKEGLTTGKVVTPQPLPPSWRDNKSRFEREMDDRIRRSTYNPYG